VEKCPPTSHAIDTHSLQLQSRHVEDEFEALQCSVTAASPSYALAFCMNPFYTSPLSVLLLERFCLPRSSVTFFIMTVLTLWIGTLLHNQSYAPLAISGLALSAALPALLISPFAAVFVDRWQKQRTMRLMDVMRALLVLSLLPLRGPGPLSFLSAPTSALPIPMKLGATYLVVGESYIKEILRMKMFIKNIEVKVSDWYYVAG
jgi:hypothetical protein